jgi:hypothetical protein
MVVSSRTGDISAKYLAYLGGIERTGNPGRMVLISLIEARAEIMLRRPAATSSH